MGLRWKNITAKEEISRSMNIITRTELNDKNLGKAINTIKSLSNESKIHSIWITQSELTKLDQVIKRDLRKNNLLGQEATDERLYIKRNDMGRRLKPLTEGYEETRLFVECCILVSDNGWIKEAWK